jgi:hypothetical protein
MIDKIGAEPSPERLSTTVTGSSWTIGPGLKISISKRHSPPGSHDSSPIFTTCTPKGSSLTVAHDLRVSMVPSSKGRVAQLVSLLSFCQPSPGRTRTLALVDAPSGSTTACRQSVAMTRPSSSFSGLHDHICVGVLAGAAQTSIWAAC